MGIMTLDQPSKRKDNISFPPRLMAPILNWKHEIIDELLLNSHVEAFTVYQNIYEFIMKIV